MASLLERVRAALAPSYLVERELGAGAWGSSSLHATPGWTASWRSRCSERIARAADLSLPAAHAAQDELEWARWTNADARGYACVARVVREVVADDMTTAGQRQRVRERAGPGGS